MARTIKLTLVLLALATPSVAQGILDIPDVSGTGDVNIDRFGKPVFGLRAQREPELRRLRAQAGRPVLNGRVEIFDVEAEQIEQALSKRMPKISCNEEGVKIVCLPE